MADEWNYRDENTSNSRNGRGRSNKAKASSRGATGASKTSQPSAPGFNFGQGFGRYGSAAKLGIKRWMLVLPWVLHILMVFWLFGQGGGGVALGIVLLVFGPMFVILINLATFAYFARKALLNARK